MLLVVSGSVPVSFYTDTDAALLLNIDMDPADPFPKCCIKIEFFFILRIWEKISIANADLDTS